MGCCIGQALCCAGEACCFMLCCCCRRRGVPKKNFARIGFVFFKVLWIALAIAVMFTAKSFIDWFPKVIRLECPKASSGATSDKD